MRTISIERKLARCKSLRAWAAQTLVSALNELFMKNQPISEVDLCNQWRAKLQEDMEAFPEGWYIPPPHGMAALFATSDNPQRTNFISLRVPHYWPREDVFLDRQEGLLFAYASPVDRETGIIGDFAVMLYFGERSDIQSHLRTCLGLNRRVFDMVEEGMTFATIAASIQGLFQQRDLTNHVGSTLTPHVTDISGHTIPGSYEQWADDELAILQAGSENWDAVCTWLSKKRKFISRTEPAFSVRPGMAFTVEPRPQAISQPQLPIVAFHTIVLCKETGEKELLTDFDALFELAGMTYMGPRDHFR